MAKFTNSLNNIKIASPCSQDWNAMIGTERKRYCGDCKLNVYNLSGMSRTEAENLITNSEGRLCVRFFRRADGSVLTQDCPVGWRAVKGADDKNGDGFCVFDLRFDRRFGFEFVYERFRFSYGRNDDPANFKFKCRDRKAGNYDGRTMPSNYPVMGDVAFPTPEPSPRIKDQGQWKVGEKSPEIMGKVVSKNFSPDVKSN